MDAVLVGHLFCQSPFSLTPRPPLPKWERGCRAAAGVRAARRSMALPLTTDPLAYASRLVATSWEPHSVGPYDLLSLGVAGGAPARGGTSRYVEIHSKEESFAVRFEGFTIVR